MVTKLTRLTHKIAIQLHLVAESCAICSSCSRRSVQKLLDTPSCVPSVYVCSSMSFVLKRSPHAMWGIMRNLFTTRSTERTSSSNFMSSHSSPRYQLGMTCGWQFDEDSVWFSIIYFLVFLLHWWVLQTNGWDCHGFTAVTFDCQLLCRRCWGSGTSRAAYKPVCWFCYIDNTFMVWPHGPGKQNDFLNHFNSYIPDIQFMEKSHMATFPFGHWHIWKTRWLFGLHSVQENDPHQPLIWMLSHTTIQWLNYLCYPSSRTVLEPSVTIRVSQEIWHSSITFRETSYNNKWILHALNQPEREDTPREVATLVTFIPFVGPTCIRISRVLSRRNIKTVGIPPKVTNFLWPFKDNIGLKTVGVYSIPHEHGKVCVW